MNYVLLIVAAIALLFALRKISLIKYSKNTSFLRDAKHNVMSLLWGIPVFIAIMLIPYQVWILTGSSRYWDGVYIIGGTAILTIAVSFVFYYKCSVKYNR
ncbi:hypothetical protein [Lentibacillus saliphilus]|uniref:hypothetical protein n=1 Tax=Lentibacillus saliphilus TaxID=2737028 RepID=UPI001C311664|nr:hypothetical protein [Lentibacillus saliphilus]